VNSGDGCSLIEIKDNVALCLFGHLRTAKRTCGSHKLLARKMNADIFGHTWNKVDTTASWHGLNHGASNFVTINDLRSLYGDRAIISISQQNDTLNNISYTDNKGASGFVGHQYHMWQSIVQSGSNALMRSSPKFLVFTRFDVRVDIDRVLRLNIKPDNWNSTGRTVGSLYGEIVEAYDLFFVIDVHTFKCLRDFLDFDYFEDTVKQRHYLLTFLRDKVIELNIQANLANAVSIRRPLQARFSKLFWWRRFAL